ncbi:sugar phosphate isomerase/epimerase family protein [Hominifimenecus sp. rT4P-3]|uniref:sugar phosphate isomerase/epimerase family protein n=1 Tax=Hominifimenecus sp. rT4P-3 TaxID=3242979 RepID=UPI003DA508C3
MVKIGVNTPLLKETIQEFGIYETMRKVSEMGYHYMELSQFDLNRENVQILKRCMADFGIEIAAVSVDIEPMKDLLGGNPKMNLQENYEEFVEACRELNCRHARTFLYGTSEFGTEEGILGYAGKFDAAARKLKEDGIDYSYHAHNFEFAKHRGKIGLRIMRDVTDTMKFEICSYWVQAGGFCTEDILREFGRDGRVSICHLKDYRIAPLTDDFLKRYYTPEHPRRILTEVVQFAEAGEGNLNIPGMIAAADEIGAEYMFLEQDYLYGRSELEVLQTDYENLCAMGMRERM